MTVHTILFICFIALVIAYLEEVWELLIRKLLMKHKILNLLRIKIKCVTTHCLWLVLSVMVHKLVIWAQTRNTESSMVHFGLDVNFQVPYSNCWWRLTCTQYGIYYHKTVHVACGSSEQMGIINIPECNVFHYLQLLLFSNALLTWKFFLSQFSA